MELDGGEREAFVPDPEVPEGFRASPGDYLRTGYDRGHLAPAGTITFSHRSRQQTMLLTNVCLQHPEFESTGVEVVGELCAAVGVETGETCDCGGAVVGETECGEDE